MATQFSSPSTMKMMFEELLSFLCFVMRSQALFRFCFVVQASYQMPLVQREPSILQLCKLFYYIVSKDFQFIRYALHW